MAKGSFCSFLFGAVLGAAAVYFTCTDKGHDQFEEIKKTVKDTVKI